MRQLGWVAGLALVAALGEGGDDEARYEDGVSIKVTGTLICLAEEGPYKDWGHRTGLKTLDGETTYPLLENRYLEQLEARAGGIHPATLGDGQPRQRPAIIVQGRLTSYLPAWPQAPRPKGGIRFIRVVSAEFPGGEPKPPAADPAKPPEAQPHGGK